MSAKKEAASSVAALKAAGETAVLNETAISIQDSTIKAAGPQVVISEYLHPGGENAVSMRELKALTGLPAREVRRFIQLERLEGVPIVTSHPGGYYLAESDVDLARFVRSMRHRAGEILKVAAAVEDKHEPKQKSEIPAETL